jgi:hypothetical protein
VRETVMSSKKIELVAERPIDAPSAVTKNRDPLLGPRAIKIIAFSPAEL